MYVFGDGSNLKTHYFNITFVILVRLIKEVLGTLTSSALLVLETFFFSLIPIFVSYVMSNKNFCSVSVSVCIS